MVDQRELKIIEEIVNQAVPCKWCGKSHSVSLLVSLAQCRHPEPEVKIFPSGEMLFIEFDEFSCENFKNNVLDYIQSLKEKLIVPNKF